MALFMSQHSLLTHLESPPQSFSCTNEQSLAEELEMALRDWSSGPVLRVERQAPASSPMVTERVVPSKQSSPSH